MLKCSTYFEKLRELCQQYLGVRVKFRSKVFCEFAFIDIFEHYIVLKNVLKYKTEQSESFTCYYSIIKECTVLFYLTDCIFSS
jgi:hypothetical protein